MHAAPVRRSDPARVQRAALLILLAWLPTLAYVGHWDAFAGTAPIHRAAHAGGPAEDSSHSQHCHAGLDSCADSASAPVPVIAPLGALRAAPEAHVVILPTDAPALVGRSDAPATPPPRDS